MFFEKKEKNQKNQKNQKKSKKHKKYIFFFRKFSKSIPIKVWPRQQNKRKKRKIKIKESRKFEKQQKILQKKFSSLTFFSSKIF